MNIRQTIRALVARLLRLLRLGSTRTPSDLPGASTSTASSVDPSGRSPTAASVSLFHAHPSVTVLPSPGNDPMAAIVDEYKVNPCLAGILGVLAANKGTDLPTKNACLTLAQVMTNASHVGISWETVNVDTYLAFCTENANWVHLMISEAAQEHLRKEKEARAKETIDAVVRSWKDEDE